jgi:uncharacterized protein YjbI with pentapeptide repeats
MPIDPRDVGELQSALNDAAGKASVLWTTFITFELYLAIAFGSVTHRDLFLNKPIKLPVLNVDLPLVGFFVVASAVLVIFHFYVFLQLLMLAVKAKDYDTLLKQEISDTSDLQYLRQRLDSFFVLQLLVGPTERRTDFDGLSLKLITWITLVGVPVLILLQGQVTFLPYHRENILWLQRVAVLIDLALIWHFWTRIHNVNGPSVARMLSRPWPIVGVTTSILIILFSVGVATFPGELANERLPDIRIIPTTWRPHWSKKDDWTSLHELLVAGTADEVSGRPRSPFSNRLVLTDQSFVDPEKLESVNISHSFRGRDLSHAVLNRADLRKADFTGSMLNGASFFGSNLEDALFECAERGTGTSTEIDDKESARRRWPDDGCTWLQDALFDLADMRGASLKQARLQGASLSLALLQGSSFWYARLQGSSLGFAFLQGASLVGAQLQGAWLDHAQLQGASLEEAQLQGASLQQAHLQGTLLKGAQLQGASLNGAELQGASLDRAQLQLASIANAKMWRASGIPEIDLTDVDGVDLGARPWAYAHETPSTFSTWRDNILKRIPAEADREEAGRRLSVLDPAPDNEPKNSINSEFWKKASASLQTEERNRRTVALLTNLACSDLRAPYVWRGLSRNSVAAGTESQLVAVAAKLREARSDHSARLGVKDFNDEDWASLDALDAEAQNTAARKRERGKKKK